MDEIGFFWGLLGSVEGLAVLYIIRPDLKVNLPKFLLGLLVRWSIAIIAVLIVIACAGGLG